MPSKWGANHIDHPAEQTALERGLIVLGLLGAVFNVEPRVGGAASGAGARWPHTQHQQAG